MKHLANNGLNRVGRALKASDYVPQLAGERVQIEQECLLFFVQVGGGAVGARIEIAARQTGERLEDYLACPSHIADPRTSTSNNTFAVDCVSLRTVHVDPVAREAP
jgi:hypothetical protein